MSGSSYILETQILGSDTGKRNALSWLQSHVDYNTIMYALSVYYRKDLWNKIIENGFACDFSWQVSALKYKELYESC